MILNLQKIIRFQLCCLIITLFTQSLFAQLNIKTSSSTSNCNATGSVSIEVFGGKPPYCYDLSSCNNCFTCINQTTITYNALEAGKYYITVTDNSIPAQSLKDSILVEGNYMPPSIYASVKGCQVSAVVTNGRPPFKYAISVDNGISYSPYQTDSLFTPVKGKYCIKVIDSCGNFSSYCSEIIYHPISFTANCNYSPTSPCVGGFRIVLNSLGEGLQPYKKFFFSHDGDTINYDVNEFENGFTFCLPQSCNWKANIIDACDDLATGILTCTNFEANTYCHDCSNKITSLYGEGGVPPYKFFYYTNSNPEIYPNPIGVDTGYYSGLPDFDNTIFRVVDSCGNYKDIKPICINAGYKFSCEDNSVIIQVGSNKQPPYKFVCESCNPPITLFDTIGIFNGISHPATISITDSCNNTMIIYEDSLKLEFNAPCGNIYSNAVYDVHGIGGLVIPEYILGGIYRLYDFNNKLIDTNYSGNFNNLKRGNYILEYECSNLGKISKYIEMGPPEFRMTAGVSAKKDSSGKCIPTYIVKTISPDKCQITDLTTGIKEDLKGLKIGDFRGVAFLEVDKPYRIQLGEDCVDTIIQLPKFDFDLKFIPPLCPSDGTIILRGAKDKNYWENWGKANTPIPIKNLRGDFYTLDCIYPPTNLTICKPDSFGVFNSIIPGSVHTAYLYINRDPWYPQSVTYHGDICPIDTLTFTFKPENYKKIDSINIDYISCQNNGLLSVKFRNGVPPYNTKIIDCNNKNVILDTISNTQNLVFKDFKPGDYCFQFIDGCGNSIDYNKSVVLPPEFFTNVSVGKCDSNIINLAVTTFEGANFIWKKLSNGSVFKEGINLNNAKYQLTNKLDTISLKIEFENCVLFEDTIQLKQPDFPIFSIKTLPITNCKHNLTYNLDMVEKPFNLLWSNGATADSISNLENGKYTLTIIDKNGCSNTIEQIVAVDTPQIKLIERIVDCKANLHANLSNGNPPYTFSWFDLSVKDSIIGLNDGNYSLTVQDANGCKSVQNLTVLIPKFEIQLDAMDTTNCNKVLVANVKNGIFTDPLNYLWDNNLISKSVTVSKSAFYKVTITDARGCLDLDSIFINSNNPELKVEKLNDLDCLSGSALHVTNGTKPLSFEWSDGFTSKDSIRYMKTGVYFVTVLDANGCRDTISFFNGDTINTKFKIYNAISPNGDLYNQKFVIEGIENYPQNEVIIYNRWGNEVYKKKNYTNLKGWDGKFTDEPLPDGTYFYYINLECLGKVFTGYIEIQR